MDQQQIFPAGQVRISKSQGSRSVRMCREPGCTRRARGVQGAKYCVDHARSIDYGPINHDNSGLKPERACCSCGRMFRRWRNTRGSSVAADICPGCVRGSPLTLQRLIAHNVPLDLQHKWLSAGINLLCDFCGKTLYRQSRPCIDHDHRCCPGDVSCGKCVRGIVCSRCNTGIGHAERLIAQVSEEKLLAWIR